MSLCPPPPNHNHARAAPLRYCGRFAPSPTGLLHAGSLVAALASWLDARAHGGTWLVRLEDVDAPRCPPGVGAAILAQLAACGLHSDAPVQRQSERHAHYAAALARLQTTGWVYACACSRKQIAAAQPPTAPEPAPGPRELRYPGTCRTRQHSSSAPVAWRLHTGQIGWQKKFAIKNAKNDTNKSRAAIILGANNPFTAATPSCPPPPQWHWSSGLGAQVRWHDRRLGAQHQAVEQVVGDFVLRRADGCWAYQLAVVVDDAAQGVTHVVRGEDLADNTARQLLLQCALDLPHPHHMHTPLVRAPNGEKLSKQTGAPALRLDDESQVLGALNAAAATLGLPPAAPSATPAQALQHWVLLWRALWVRA